MPQIHRTIRTLLQGAWAAAFVLTAGTVRAQDENSPQGWLGVFLSRTPSGTIVDSVVPRGPAQAAGLVAGDTILRFNGVDARHDLTGDGLRRLLTPGRRITMQLRRNGAVRTRTVVIAKRPPTLIESQDTVVYAQSGSQSPDTADYKGTARLMITSTLPPVPILSLNAEGASAGIVQFVGASLVPMTGDLADVLRVTSKGMFVVAVAPATPARKAGLKGGDVILTVDSAQTATPAVFVKLLSRKRGRGSSGQRVQLNIIRKGEERHIMLRW